MVRGLGLGLVFIPISTVAFSGLKGAQIAQGAALYNLLRQLGGSFGIAVLSIYITNMTAYHRSNMVSHLYSGSVTVQERLNAISGGLRARGYSAETSHVLSVGLLNHTVQAQAMTMAYNNAFILLGLSFVVAMPAVILLRPKKGTAAPTDAH